MIAAKHLPPEGDGFGTDTNVVTLITEEDTEELPILSKEETARCIFDRILEKMG